MNGRLMRLFFLSSLFAWCVGEERSIGVHNNNPWIAQTKIHNIFISLWVCKFGFVLNLMSGKIDSFNPTFLFIQILLPFNIQREKLWIKIQHWKYFGGFVTNVRLPLKTLIKVLNLVCKCTSFDWDVNV